MKLSLRGRETAFLALVQGALAYEWLDAGIEKATSASYIPGMSATIGAFASKNPNGGFASFLAGTIQPHAEGWGYLVMYGEILTGIALALGAVVMLFKTGQLVYQSALGLTAVGLLVGVVMNFCYWQAAGWTSASTDGINVEMLLVSLILGAATITALVASRSREVARQTFNVAGAIQQIKPGQLVHR